MSAEPPTPAIRFEGVSKRFGDAVALSNLNLSIQRGELVSLLGPSGSGKTTTLNLLAGLIRPDEGKIHIGDRVVNDVSPHKRNLAMVFQSYALYPHLTVHENLAFPLHARRVPRPEIPPRVERAAEMLGLGELLHRYPKELSGGQQQRVALGRAMVRDPEIFLLDEPLSNLDARLRIRMRLDIKALHERLNSTLIYVTHDQAEAMTLSSRIAVFNLGVLQQVGTPYEIYDHPANTFVANFVGDREINFLEGRLERADDGGWRLVTQSAEVPVGRHVPEQAVGQRVRVAIRPEAVELRGSAEPGSVPATVQETELVGPDLIVYLRLGPDATVCSRADPHGGFRKGDSVHALFPPERLHFFDDESGTAMRVLSAPNVRSPIHEGALP